MLIHQLSPGTHECLLAGKRGNPCINIPHYLPLPPIIAVFGGANRQEWKHHGKSLAYKQ